LEESITLFLFFVVAVVWQFIAHYIRILMLKFYFAYGYSFELSEIHLLLAPEQRRRVGISTLGWSRRREAVFPLSWIADGLYLTMCMLMPLLLLYLYLEYFMFSASKLMLILWLIVSLGLLLLLNSLRYRKFKPYIKRYTPKTDNETFQFLKDFGNSEPEQ
jgi:hypothetical protein